MNWQDQNKIGIAWNQVYETMRVMWSIYHRTGDQEAKKAAEKIADMFHKMSGVIDD